MRIYEIILICLMFALLIFSIIIMYAVLKREKCLIKRAQINYNNYMSLKKYFFLQKEAKVLVSCIVDLCLILVAFILVILNDILFSYIYLLGILFVIVLLGFIAYQTSTKLNRDLSPFDEFYHSIQSSYNNRNKVMQNIDLIDSKYESLNSETITLNSKLKELINDFKVMPSYEDSYIPLNKLKQEQVDILNTFDNKMPSIFSSLLVDYLKNGGVFNRQTNIFNPNIDMDLDAVLSKVKNNFKNIFLAYVLEAFHKQNHSSGKALVEIIKILLQEKLFKKEYVDNIIDLIIQNPEEYSDVIELLYAERFVDYEFIKEALDKDYTWVFEHRINNLVNDKQIEEIVTTIIIENKLIIANKFIVLADRNMVDAIKCGIESANIKNESSTVITKYIELLELDSDFNSVSNRYENIVYTLKNYYKAINKNDSTLNKILENENYYSVKNTLDRLYNEELSKFEPILSKTFNSILYYSLYEFKFDLFSIQKINSLYVEFKRRLNYQGMLCLGTLLDGIMLYHIDNKNEISVIVNNIELVKEKSFYGKYYPYAENLSKNPKLQGRTLIQNLFKNHNSDIYTIINHIETERLVIDKVKNI